MIFALLFIASVLLGLACYHFSVQWVYAVVVPCLLYLVLVLLDENWRAIWYQSLIFGLPIVFSGGLLGAYIYQTRFVYEPESSEESQQTDDLDAR